MRQECHSAVEEDSTTNVSLDSTIFVSKTLSRPESVSSLAIEAKKAEESALSTAASAAPLTEDRHMEGDGKKSSKKLDMFSPEVDMFAEEYNVSDPLFRFWKTKSEHRRCPKFNFLIY